MPTTKHDTLSYDQLRRVDLSHLWHPFTQQKIWVEQNDPLIIERAAGCELIDLSGKRYLDGVSSLWCNVHGHGVPEIVQAIQQQAERVCHTTLLGLSHVPILELTTELMKIVPKRLTRAFYCDSGSAAVEAGLRMASEWWQKQRTRAGKRKRKCISLQGSYHGDTLGAVRVGFDEVFHWPLKALLVEAQRVPPPHIFKFYEDLFENAALEASLQKLQRLFKREGDSIAAFVIEPLVQGAAGMWIQPVEYLREVAELCRRYNIILLADEVATGFGKTGTMFAIEQAGIVPDILIMGKGLSGGYLPISAAVTTEEIYSGFLGDAEELKSFFFGQTFAGNPLAAAAATANLKLFTRDGVLEKVGSRIKFLHSLLDERIAPLKHVDQIRRCGLMVGIELTQTPGKHDSYPISFQAGNKITRAARERGVVIRPLGNVMVLMPALAMEQNQLEMLVDVTAESIKEVLG